jgi:peptidylprolyl isomerase
MAYRIILYTGIMKKSEKLKGKQAVALKKKKQVQYGMVAGAGVIIVAVLLLVVFNPFVAKTGDTVNIYYTGTLDDGTIFDSNVNGSPLTFTVGKGMVIPGFEEAVIGMAVNNEKTVRIPPEKAYGLYNASFVHVINRTAFPSNLTPVVGQYYSVRSTIDGSESSVKVINVTASTITLDSNHALAGQNLTFSIRLAAINPK